MTWIYSNYYIVLILQGICVLHAVKTGNTQKWIWLIVFLPLIGCIAYIYSEIWNPRNVQNIQANLGSVINPGGRIKELEQKLRFSDTFNNKVALADACLANGETDRAIELYESGLKGTFADNEHVLTQLILAYFQNDRFADAVNTGKKIRHLYEFPRSKAHLYYTLALEKTGNAAEAEKEFKSMNGRFSNFEFRYCYGLFLKRNNRPGEAEQLFSDLLDEEGQLSSRERKQNREWFNRTREALRN